MLLVERSWGALEAAMGWIAGAGDSNGDGFVDYARATAKGLVNQGWKDSSDSVFHADGMLADPPIALVEVQGYAYAAMEAMAWLAGRRGDQERGRAWRTRAKRLRAAVERRFWLPGRGRRWSPRSFSPRPSTTAGACGRLRPMRRASTRCPTTTARCGPTTPRSARRAWRNTAIVAPPRRS